MLTQRQFDARLDWRESHCVWVGMAAAGCGGSFAETLDDETMDGFEFEEGADCPFCGAQMTRHATPEEAAEAARDEKGNE